jgi:class 3 adenylate cyclase
VTESAKGADILAAAREAHGRYAWSEALDKYLEAERDGELSPDDLERLADCAWWMSDLTRSIAARERAFAAHMHAGFPRRAAAVAVLLAKDEFQRGASSVATGWMQRATRLLEPYPDSLEQGHLERLKAVVAIEGQRDPDLALAHAERALELATALEDADLHALALHDKGRALVHKGEVAEGLALLEEASATAVSGDLRPLTTGIVYCNMISALEALGDYGRAGEWTEAATRWCERRDMAAGFPGICRVHRAGIMRLRGAWPEAEREAERAVDELRGFYVPAAAEGFYELGEVRRRRGDFGAAEEAYAQAYELGRDPQPGLALLRLAQGDVDGALASVERALGEEAGLAGRGRLLAARTEITLAQRDIDAARAAVQELEELAHRAGTPALAAAAHEARGAVLLAEGAAAEAHYELRRACELWRQIDAPYELALTRLLLGRAYAEAGDRGTAVLEFQAASATFDRLGALPDARRAAELLEPVSSDPGRREARTFLFSDIAESTGLLEAIGDDAWQDLLRWHDRTLRGLFAEHRGEEIDHAGDSFFVAFPDPSHALACAVKIQRTLAAHRRAHGFAPRVRVGVHAAEATRADRTFRGKGVHEAARIAALADAGEILASVATVADSGFAHGDSRLVRLKGIAEAVGVATVEWR